MSNPFDDLEAETAESPNTEDGAGEDGAASVDEEATGSAAPEDAGAGSIESTASSPAESGPAFEYDAVRQRPLYARGESWDAFEKKLRTTIAPELAREDVVDEETREIHDAVLRLATEEPERIAELVLEARREE
ncbi:hypothetical protein [Natronococcus occultus]|uniref:Uncharacterized protein n=1 Tax=Natronococcus occultus SP4 TaxID=694430 RepID=L0K4X6_9EURY|nr:hypothetical protein [Natronococcus occultus]AGB39414.1 hypothetical protein Natoc_3699 [Natronococcus occultus SP4]